MKTHYLSILLLLMSSVAIGQIRSNTPLSRFGYGEIDDKNYAIGDAMNGAVTALRTTDGLNFANPAALTALDSMTFIFELGLSAKAYTFSENGTSANAFNSGLDYIAFAFPIAKFWRTGGGLSPFSNKGYAFQTFKYGADTLQTNIQATGGINQVYWSNGFLIAKGLSVGVNAYYLWGQTERFSTALLQNRDPQNPIGTFSNKAQKLDICQTKGFIYSLGAQYQFDISDQKSVIAGATFTPAQKLTYNESKTVSTVLVPRDTIRTENLKTDMPMSIALGASYQKKDNYLISADIEMTKWSGLSIYGLENNFDDYLRLSVGGEWLPEKYSMNFFKRIKYRGGLKFERLQWVSLDANNAKVNYSNLSLSAGFGLPFKQSRNTVHISAEIGKHFASSSEALTDQYLLLKVNITLFDKWFHKRKID